MTQDGNTYTYAYNGLGDRLQQIANGQTTNYTLDLNAGLTQVLDDGTNTYTYGVDRISQQHGSTAEYYLDDALGSTRQLSSTARYQPRESTGTFVLRGAQGLCAKENTQHQRPGEAGARSKSMIIVT